MEIGFIVFLVYLSIFIAGGIHLMISFNRMDTERIAILVILLAYILIGMMFALPAFLRGFSGLYGITWDG